MPNIKDYVKYDERSEKIIRDMYEERLNKEGNIYRNCDNLYYDIFFSLEKERDELIEKHKKENRPVGSSLLRSEMAIQWAEANPGMSFSQAVFEVNKCINGEDLSECDINTDDSISLDEAKQMLKVQTSKASLSDSLINESLSLLKNESKLINNLHVSNYNCYIEIGLDSYIIPIFVLKELVANSTGIVFNKGDDIKEYIEKVKKINLPTKDWRWPEK